MIKKKQANCSYDMEMKSMVINSTIELTVNAGTL